MPDGKSLVCARLKRKRPILEINDGELHESLSNDADDFPTAFNFRSNRPVRRRLCTQLAETNDGELHGSPSSHANDFPTAFNFRSNRPVRRRSYTQLTDFPRPDSAMAAQSRKKRKAYMSERSRVLRQRLAHSSSSIYDKDASSSHTTIPTNGHSHDSYVMLNHDVISTVRS
jgi:hypothetical protein